MAVERAAEAGKIGADSSLDSMQPNFQLRWRIDERSGATYATAPETEGAVRANQTQVGCAFGQISSSELMEFLQWARSRKVTSINLSGVPVLTVAHAEALGAADGVDTLDISFCTLSAEALTALLNNRVISSLRAEPVFLVGESRAVEVRGNPSLVDVRIGGTWLDDRFIADLRALPNLEQVLIRSDRATDEGVAKLITGARLRDVDVRGCPRVGQATLAAAISSQSVRTFLATDGEECREIPVAAADWGATAVGLGQVSGEVLRQLHLRNLTRIELRDTSAPEAVVVEILRANPGLEDVTFSGEFVTPVILRALARLPRLRRLALADTDIGEDECRALSRTARLAELDIRGGSLSAGGLTQLLANARLRSLHIERTGGAVGGVAGLRDCTELSELSILAEPVDDSIWEAIRDLSSLRTVRLFYCRGVAKVPTDLLKRLPYLEDLELSHTRVTGAAVGRLEGGSQLHSFALAHVPLRDVPSGLLTTHQRLGYLFVGSVGEDAEQVETARSLARRMRLYSGSLPWPDTE